MSISGEFVVEIAGQDGQRKPFTAFPVSAFE
jgi:hypothetical protein